MAFDPHLVTTAHRGPGARLTPLFALAILATALLAGLGAGPAQAHSALISATPEDGDELDEAPAAVVLTFNEDITDLGTDIVVAGPDGADATDGETEIDGADVSRALASDLGAGQYTVTWRAVSADGHPIDGESTFTLTESAAADADAAAASEPATTEGSEEETSGEETSSPAPDDSSAAEDAEGAPEDGGSDGDQAEADSANAAEGAADDSGTSGGEIALFVVIALAVFGAVTVLIVRMRRQR